MTHYKSKNPEATNLPIEKLLENFGRRLEQFRIVRHLKQADLATLAGVSVPTIVRLEAGKNGSLETVARLLRALGLDDRLLQLIPDATLSPLDPRSGRGKRRQRVRDSAHDDDASTWTWGEEAP